MVVNTAPACRPRKLASNRDLTPDRAVIEGFVPSSGKRDGETEEDGTDEPLRNFIARLEFRVRPQRADKGLVTEALCDCL
jgi:hypothetical protein